jgi:hypothetical protein
MEMSWAVLESTTAVPFIRFSSFSRGVIFTVIHPSRGPGDCSNWYSSRTLGWKGESCPRGSSF